MVKTIPRLSMLLLLLVATGCESTSHVDAGAAPLPWFGRTRGSAVVLSRDERVAVVTNRTAGVVTIFGLDPDKPLEKLVQRSTEIDMGAGSEPWAAVIGGDDDTAFVVSRRDQSVRRISNLRRAPRLNGSVHVGSEPTAIAIAPSGNRLFVANWGDGTISVITVPDFGLPVSMRGVFDLNKALVGTGVLGAVESRWGLAHPRALALTDDGDDDDGEETLYATEFFSMPLLAAGSSADPGFFDRNRQGFVYPIPLAVQSASKNQVSDPIPIAPVLDTGFVDAKGATTGCFPNQLYAAAVDGDRLFVTSICASPAGPLGPAPPESSDPAANFKTVVHPAVFVIDTRTNQELAEQHQILTHELDQRYASDNAVNRRMPLIPNDIAFTAPTEPGTRRASLKAHEACITAMGADAVFCIQYDATGRALDIGSPGKRYADLAPPYRSGASSEPSSSASSVTAGKLPVGIALSTRGDFGLVVNDNSDNLSVLDLAQSIVREVEPTVARTARAARVRDSDANAGRQRFATGLRVWSFHGEAWVSCESCHPDGLSDGVTWFFARGPRRTISTAGTYYGDGDQRMQRMLLWTGNADEVHDVEGIVRTVAGGVGAVLWQYQGTPSNAFRIVYDGSAVPQGAGEQTSTLRNNLNGSVKELLLQPTSEDGRCSADTRICDRSLVHEWDLVDAFIQSVRAPRRPTELDPAQVESGAKLFANGGCAGCHGGPGWTLSRVFYTPGAVNNGALPYSRPAAITEDQLGRLRTETYDVPPDLRMLNPPGSTGTATLRRWDPPADRDWIVHLYGKKDTDGYDSSKTHSDDQINCVLRDVGTFPSQTSGENKQGIVAKESPTALPEVRAADMQALALGATGFNIPSLVGIAAGAPYFHAGNARSLEELFDTVFSAHHQALSPGFLDEGGDRVSQVRDLIAYLLSIDDDRLAENVDPKLDLCPAPGLF